MNSAQLLYDACRGTTSTYDMNAVGLIQWLSMEICNSEIDLPFAISSSFQSKGKEN